MGQTLEVMAGASPGSIEHEERALRRVAAAMRAEADELPAGSWVRRRLEEDVAVDGWGELVLPQLAALMREHEPEPRPDRWVRRRGGSCPLLDREEAALRRLAVLMRAEAAELEGAAAALARRLDGWGIRLALECEHPLRPVW